MSRRRHKPLPKEPVSATITGLSHEGRGICQIEGKTTFVQGALPGETVSFKYTRKSRQVDEGLCVEVEESPHPDRVTPECQFYEMCGGCSLQHLSMPAQIQLKQDTLIEQLKHFGNISAEEILPPLAANEWGYRTKARLGVRHIDKKEKTLVGFRERNGRYIANMDQCEVLHPKVGRKIEALSQLISQLSCFRELPQIEVAITDDACALIFRHLADLTEQDEALLCEFGREHDFHIYSQPNKPHPIALLFPEKNAEHKLLSYHLPHHDIEIQFHPTDFTQINIELNQQMVDQAVDLLALEKSDSVLDLFCGIGNFTLPLARSAKQVTGVEGAAVAIERAKQNAKLNSIRNVDFYEANLFEDFSSKPWVKQTYDKILLDPPRSGAEKIIEAMPKLKPKRLVYVSCNPATLARDAGVLVKTHGYTLKKAGVMNMFPHTSHVESIALFIKD